MGPKNRDSLELRSDAETSNYTIRITSSEPPGEAPKPRRKHHHATADDNVLVCLGPQPNGALYLAPLASMFLQLCNKYVDPDDPMLRSVGGSYNPLRSFEELRKLMESFPAYAGELEIEDPPEECKMYRNEAGYQLAFGTAVKSGKPCWFLWDGLKCQTEPDIWTCSSTLPTPPAHGVWTKFQARVS